MRRNLTLARTIGVPVVPPEVAATSFNAALDALNTGSSLKGHWPMADLAARIGPAPITAVGTHETGLPQIAAGGVASRGFDGTGSYGTIALTSNADFLGPAGTVLVPIQPDSVAIKNNLVNLNNGTLAGGFSLEVLAGGVPRVFKRYSDSANISIQGSAGLVVAGRPWLLATTWGLAGLKLYLLGANRAPGEIEPGSNSQASWPSNVPATQGIYVGRWQASALDFYNGVIGHLAWYNRQLSLAELETLAPLLRQVAYLPSFNAGNVAEGVVTKISTESRGHPISNYDLTRVSPNPTKGVATVDPANKTHVDYDATTTPGTDTFGLTLTANGTVSAPATITVNVAAAATPEANPDTATTTAGAAAFSLNVLGNDTIPSGVTPVVALVAGSYDAARFSLVSNDVRFTPPATLTAPQAYSCKYTVSGSSQATVTVTVNPAGLPYTPFAFVTVRNPTEKHSGTTPQDPDGPSYNLNNKPSFNANDPDSNFVRDPMSGLKIFRITGARGTAVMVDNGSGGMTNSGLVWPNVIKSENAPRCQRSFNGDGSLLMLQESKSNIGTEPSGTLCRTVLIDVTGEHGSSGVPPWRVIRASSSGGFGEVPIAGWFWDWRSDANGGHPLRAFAAHSDGMYEWWPWGGPGNTIGQKTRLWTWPGGFRTWEQPRGGRQQSSHDGLWYIAPIQRTSDGWWGGMRVALHTTAPAGGRFGPFVPNPTHLGLSGVEDTGPGNLDRAATGIGGLGIHGHFNKQGIDDPDAWRMCDFRDGDISNTNHVIGGGHVDAFHRDGAEYLFAFSSGSWRTTRMDNAQQSVVANDSFTGGYHVSTRNFLDTFERHGATGGSLSGVRYALGSSYSQRMGIIGIRLGADDVSIFRYLAHPRTQQKGSNSRELHPGLHPDFKFVVFNSMWWWGEVLDSNGNVVVPHMGNGSLDEINNYIIEIPDAWYSPNNSGLSS